MKQKSKEPQRARSPYLDARREWNERYGGYIANARTWRLVALASLLIAAVSVAGIIYFAGQNKLIPYIVETDGEGEVSGSYLAEQIDSLDQRIIRAQIGQFVKDVRAVSSDVAVQRTAVERAYALLSGDMPAYTAVNQWFRENVPFERAADQTVVVELGPILPLSAQTWRIEWTERPRTRNGEPLPPTHWTGAVSVVPTGQVNPQTVMYNPTGLIIREFDWSRDYDSN